MLNARMIKGVAFIQYCKTYFLSYSYSYRAFHVYFSNLINYQKTELIEMVSESLVDNMAIDNCRIK